MEKDFSKAISNNEKKKKRNSRFYCPIWNPFISFEIELKIVSFTFETRNFPIRTRISKEPVISYRNLVSVHRSSRMVFEKFVFVEFLGAVIFTPYFSISIRREGGERLYSQRTSRHLCTRTRPSGTVYVTQLKSRYLRIQRKERGGAFSTHIFSHPHLVRLLSRHPRRAVVESCSGYDESRLSWSRSYSIPPVHRIFAYLNEREREEASNENFSNGVVSIEWVIINSLTQFFLCESNYFILRDCW